MVVFDTHTHTYLTGYVRQGLLGNIFTQSNNCLETRKQRIEADNSEINKSRQTNSNGDSELDPLAALITLQLELLLCCCKGLQSPLDDEMRTGDERIQLYRQTMDDRARVLVSGGMAVELLRSMEHIIQGAVMLWPHEPEVAEVTNDSTDAPIAVYILVASLFL
jgi:hypothetical protein